MPDKNGHNFYNRPVVILTATAEIPLSHELVGVVASHTAYHESPRPHHYVEIPSHPDGACLSGLKKGTVACCRWIVLLEKANLGLACIKGMVTPRVLEIIVIKIREHFGAKQPITLDSEMPPS